MAQPLAPILKEVVESPWSAEPEVFSELSLRGAAGNCLNLLAPILRELSQDQDARWLTLIAPPASLTQAWLRDAGLNRERILLLQPRGAQSAQQLTCEALRLGRSHTVVSWLNPLSTNLTATTDQRRPDRGRSKPEYSTGLTAHAERAGLLQG